jgi:cytochrome c-type biogenesis protein CcmH
MQKILLAILVYLMSSQIVAINCYSVEPDEFLQNPEKELRARNISKNIRCLVCQNQSIDESSAPLAKDLRILIRKKIEHGNSDEEIYNFLAERYGDFILLNPPFKISTFFLWILPFVFIVIGIFVIFLHNNKSKKLDYNK